MLVALALLTPLLTLPGVFLFTAVTTKMLWFRGISALLFSLYRADDPAALVASFDDLSHPTVEGTSLRAALNRALVEAAGGSKEGVHGEIANWSSNAPGSAFSILFRSSSLSPFALRDDRLTFGAPFSVRVPFAYFTMSSICSSLLTSSGSTMSEPHFSAI